MKAWKNVLLDTILITFGLSTLSLMSVAEKIITEYYHITSDVYYYQHIAYVVGLFFAFLLGSTRIYQGSFKRAVFTAISFAAIPQIAIPYVSNWWAVVALRFIQGFVISLVPLFSTQVGRLFVAERPFAKGIILSGIFWGGLLGGIYAKVLIGYIGWKLTFVVTGLAMYLVFALWYALTEDFTIISERKKVEESPFKMAFTWVLGFTFFPALWVIFTIVGFVASVGYSMNWSKSMVYDINSTLNISKALWSIVMGYIGYVLSRRRPDPKGLFRAIVIVMIISYAISFVGILMLSKGLLSNSYNLVLLSTVLVGAIQGTGPAFWTSAPAVYPKEIYPRASFALGLISNSANAIAPIVTDVARYYSLILALGELSAMPILGIIVLVICSRMKLPIEKETISLDKSNSICR